jgi:cadmium resistance protein CadD (predicted permease)
MSSVIEVAALGLVTFAATNIDDLFVLVAFFSDPTYKARHVVLGQYAGIAGLTGGSMACALLTLAIPRPYVGLLGLAPIAIGIKKLLERRADGLADAYPRPSRGSTVLSVAAVTVANGGDNVAVYVPVFASHTWPQRILLACLFGVLTGVWCMLAHGLVHHRTIGMPLRRYGRHLLPWVLIGLGAWILLSSRGYSAAIGD